MLYQGALWVWHELITSCAELKMSSCHHLSEIRSTHAVWTSKFLLKTYGGSCLLALRNKLIWILWSSFIVSQTKIAMIIIILCLYRFKFTITFMIGMLNGRITVSDWGSVLLIVKCGHITSEMEVNLIEFFAIKFVFMFVLLHPIQHRITITHMLHTLIMWIIMSICKLLFSLFHDASFL